jgi:predicted dehydrogenase
MTGVAIFGCGAAGVRHAQAFQHCGADVIWTIDTAEERAQSLSQLLNGIPKVSSNYQAALQDSRVEAVDICLPHNLHEPVTLASVQAGKHILCEKPMAATLEEADRMINACEKAGVILMIAENERFNPLYLKVRELLDQEVIGQPALVLMTRQCYLTRSFLEERRWFLNAKAAAGGIMMSGGVHDFSTALYLIGDVESVYSLRAPQRFLEMEGDDTSVALVRFKNGVVGTFVQSFVMKSLITAAGSEIHTLRIDGQLGSLEVKDQHIIQLYSEKEDLRQGETITQHDIYIPKQNTFELEVKHFLHCLNTGSTPLTDGRSMRRPLEIVLAAYRSMETGQPVHLMGYQDLAA